MNQKGNNLEKLAKLIRYYILVCTTAAGSGHPSSSLSATDLMTVLMFAGHFKFDLDNPLYVNNDRLIFSKGHASPLFYSLYAAAGKVTEEELLTLRKFGSHLEGHPTMGFPYTEVPTGSLGQGLSVGLGMALNAKLEKLSYKTYVLLGDSEMAEGSVWEAMSLASHYKANNLVGILDVNRLGQRGETLYGHDTEIYQKRAEAFGWQAIVIDGHNLDEIEKAYQLASQSADKPVMIIAKTLKGKGISILEDKEGKHGVALKKEELEPALKELGEVEKGLVGEVSKPDFPTTPSRSASHPSLAGGETAVAASPPYKGGVPRLDRGEVVGVKFTDYPADKLVATRKAYGNALAALAMVDERIVVLDAETSNSTYSEFVKKNNPEKFFEMYIAEQNMAGVALGFSRRGKVPFTSTFAAFFSRAFDQIRMSQYADSNIKFVGSHAGVSIGEDGASQMGLEEIAMFRTLLGSVVLYPSDGVSTEKLVVEAAKHHGNVYIQTTRKDTAILYSNQPVSSPASQQALVYHDFKIGGSCTLRSSDSDRVTVIGAGVTLHEALGAYEELKKEGINIRVIDLYSIKPLDVETLKKAAAETGAIIIVEDNFEAGGIFEAVAGALSSPPPFRRSDEALAKLDQGGARGGCYSLAVTKMPHSGKPEELLAYEEIDKNAIIKKIKNIIS